MKKGAALWECLCKELLSEIAPFPHSDNFLIASLLLLNPEELTVISSELTVDELLTDLRKSAFLADIWEEVYDISDAILLMDERGSWSSRSGVHVDTIIQNLNNKLAIPDRNYIPDEELDLMDTLVELEGLAGKIHKSRFSLPYDLANSTCYRDLRSNQHSSRRING